ncbi:hypothetical protein FYK55_08115 [Roseiconus nitratireducens]|uniref:Uncharacterized protein n=1 Tax=Roseiconus nitratireducens TaxID=2605748 RepID=A0A5M6DGF1_9BACT|nr:hypothetical protein [Roseiconus nitratireducens]KAA5544305.1 hypothetical protein FYK55_08115 [Roseiconus nitratireducens]
MNTDRIDDMEKGIAISRQFAKQQLQSTSAMVVSAALAFFVARVVGPGIDGLALAIAAATGVSVGVWSQPDAYRRNGSLTLAIVLIAGMWAVPLFVFLISLFP